MNRYFDFSPGLWDGFHAVDRRFGVEAAGRRYGAACEPVLRSLPAVRVVLWDLYGTILSPRYGDLDQTAQDERALLRAAKTMVNEFSLEQVLSRYQPDRPAHEALCRLYQRGIEQSHQRSIERGIECPEVKIEKIWQGIIELCVEHGLPLRVEEPIEQSGYRWGYFFDQALQQIVLYPHVAEALLALRKAGVTQGIVSNAQFYTPIHLRRLLREETGRDNFELNELFDESLLFFSYELGYSKPNPGAFDQAIKVLRERDIGAGQVLYIGNDMLKDIYTAKQAGFHTAMFAGDASQVVLREDEPCCRGLKPDLVLTNYRQLLECVKENTTDE